jgi:hypothetical protein
MNEKSIENKIEYYRNVFTLFWPSLFVVGSGIIWTFSYYKGIVLYLAVILGGIFWLFLFITVIYLNKNIKRLIEELKK